MPDRSSNKHPNANRTDRRGKGPKPHDINVTAFSVFQQAIGEAPKEEAPVKNPAAVTLGRMGGLKGGKARAAKLTPEERIEIAKKAAEKRWGKD